MKLSATTAYHPQANGLVERLHRRLKDALKARLKGPDWADQLPWIVLGLRTEPKEDLNLSTAELVYRAPILIPGELVTSSPGELDVSTHLRQLRENIGSLRPVPTSRHGEGTSAVPALLMNAFRVCAPRCSICSAPGPVRQSLQGCSARGEAFPSSSGDAPRQEVMSIDCLKVAHLNLDITPTMVLPKRGRPPRALPVPSGSCQRENIPASRLPESPRCRLPPTQQERMPIGFSRASRPLHAMKTFGARRN